VVPVYEAVILYERAHQHSGWRRIGARLLGRSSRLLDLNEIVAGNTISARHYLGPQTVPIRQIRGTEGQRDTFDDVFHPLTTRTRGRWVSIASAWLQGASMPPIDLIRLGDVYFVRDGHHRVSVARALGQQEIDAFVTVWDVSPSPLLKKSAASLPS
jgi:hypothetical protein